MLAPVLTPRGLLILRQMEEVPASESERNSRLEEAFLQGPGHGLLCLGADEVGTALPPLLSYWRGVGGPYLTALFALPRFAEGGGKPPVPVSPNHGLDKIVHPGPPLTAAG